MQLFTPILRRKEPNLLKTFAAERVVGSYFVCTNDGLYYLANGLGRQISTLGGYGLATDGVHVVRTVDVKRASQIVSFEYFYDELKLECGEIIYEMPFKSTNGRIHQLSCDINNNTFFAALAERNSILQFSLVNGGWCFKEFTPFTDRFGAPILFDHNHINSVLPHNGFLLFVAYKAGTGSMIGIIRGDQVLGFGYPNQGMHDIFITKSGFLCFDTFGGSEDQGGRPITENGPTRSPLFDDPPGYILRGAAQIDCETVYGHSHKGERSKRFEGNGVILHFKDGSFSYYPIPSAQIYQIVRNDGLFFESVDKPVDLIVSQLTHVFGQPVYNGVVAYM